MKMFFSNSSSPPGRPGGVHGGNDPDLMTLPNGERHLIVIGNAHRQEANTTFWAAPEQAGTIQIGVAYKNFTFTSISALRPLSSVQEIFTTLPAGLKNSFSCAFAEL